MKGQAMEEPGRNRLCALSAVILLAVFAFISLRDSPYVAELSFVPAPLGRWLDGQPNSRHFAGYTALAVVCGIGFCAGRTVRHWLAAVSVLLALAAALEAAQLLLPNRHADWRDLGLSWAGIAAGSADAWFLNRMLRRRRST